MSDSLNIRNAVCAVGFDAQSEKLVGWAAQAAASFAARLFLVHVMPSVRPSKSAVARVREKVEALKQECGAKAEVIIAGGEVPETVCREAERLDAGLLIIGRSPQSAIFGRLPTNAYAIVRDSPCPVVSV